MWREDREKRDIVRAVKKSQCCICVQAGFRDEDETKLNCSIKIVQTLSPDSEF